MDTYVILRRAAWSTMDEVGAAAQRSGEVGEEMSEDVAWLRSYILEDPGERLGTVCVYQATSPEAIREHAARVGMPSDEIIRVADTVIIRSDAEAVTS
jgi:hypothetical protein